MCGKDISFMIGPKYFTSGGEPAQAGVVSVGKDKPFPLPPTPLGVPPKTPT